MTLMPSPWSTVTDWAASRSAAKMLAASGPSYRATRAMYERSPCPTQQSGASARTRLSMMKPIEASKKPVNSIASALPPRTARASSSDRSSHSANDPSAPISGPTTFRTNASNAKTATTMRTISRTPTISNALTQPDIPDFAAAGGGAPAAHIGPGGGGSGGPLGRRAGSGAEPSPQLGPGGAAGGSPLDGGGVHSTGGCPPVGRVGPAGPGSRDVSSSPEGGFAPGPQRGPPPPEDPLMATTLPVSA